MPHFTKTPATGKRKTAILGILQLFTLLALFALPSTCWAMCSTPVSGCVGTEAKVRAALRPRATTKCVLLTKDAFVNDEPSTPTPKFAPGSTSGSEDAILLA